jgi:Na+-transporting NADH:ubiquinone oxidoreductase subunit A
MVHIKIVKGLDIPIKGKPTGPVHTLTLGGEAYPQAAPSQLALDLTPFTDIKFRLLVKPGDTVKLGQPLAEDRKIPGRMFVSPAGGTIHEIRRGAKRALTNIIIDTAKSEQRQELKKLNPSAANRDELIEVLMLGGIFSLIRVRPFNLLANPTKKPRSIFVKALESAPFAPPAELQVEGYEAEFQKGLDALAKLTEGAVHLVYHKDSTCKAFTGAKNVQLHTAEGPHPIANPSLHIQQIDPILSPEDVIWTLNVHDVVSIGFLLAHGYPHVQKVISIAGPGVLSDRIGYYKVREGMPIAALVSGRVEKGVMRLISGDPLMGHKVQASDFLGFSDYVFCVIPENQEREFLHFFRLGTDKYTFSRAYLSGHFNNADKDYAFTTNQHGEHRAFIDGTLYDKVMPLNIPTMHLVKAVMAEDFELAEKLGLLEVVSEDFALPTFVCPSKMEMTEIMKQGLERYSKEVLQ